MGREIRRVPVDWQHPTEKKRYYHDSEELDYFKPLYDKSFGEAVHEWYDELQDWLADKDGARSKHAPHYDGDPLVGYFEYAGRGPDEETCRPAFTSEPIAYQVYETVSEGAPVSPVCATREEMILWLTEDHPHGWPGQPSGDRQADARGYWWRGISREAAERFLELESVPSGISTPETGFLSGVEALNAGRL